MFSLLMGDWFRPPIGNWLGDALLTRDRKFVELRPDMKLMVSIASILQQTRKISEEQKFLWICC
jgi:hypothetical protein